MPTSWQRSIVISLILSLAVLSSFSVRSADTAPLASPNAQAPVAQQRLSAPELDHAIQEVISQNKYAWRLPRAKVVEADAEKGPIAKFFTRILQTARDWAQRLLEWLEKLLRPKRTPVSKGPGWMTSVQGLIFLLTAIVVSALAILLYRVWRKRRHQAAIAAAEPVASIPDVADENVDANQLPEDGWIQLGRDLLERGELRLAIRAFYLASLTHLAARSMISIAKFKSNRDYERELQRRAHALPDLLSVFGENVSVFDRIWYGLHEVNQAIVAEFAANVQKIKAA